MWCIQWSTIMFLDSMDNFLYDDCLHWNVDVHYIFNPRVGCRWESKQCILPPYQFGWIPVIPHMVLLWICSLLVVLLELVRGLHSCSYVRWLVLCTRWQTTSKKSGQCSLQCCMQSHSVYRVSVYWDIYVDDWQNTLSCRLIVQCRIHLNQWEYEVHWSVILLFPQHECMDHRENM